MYGKTNEIVELLSKAIRFIVTYASTFGFVLPKAIYCFYLYFMADMGEDAFELPFPTW